MLKVEELAKILIDCDLVICPFCEKGEPLMYLEHHQENCPFTIAYQVLTPEVEEDIGMDAAAIATELAHCLNIDDAVRTVAQSGKNHDYGPNWYAEWEGMVFGATFGAGTNSANISTTYDGQSVKQALYRASDYGRHIEIFRYGPWVDRLLDYAEGLREANKVEAEESEVASAARKKSNFQEVDF